MISMFIHIGLMVTLGDAKASLPPPPSGAAEVVPVSFATSNGWEYDGRVELPAPDKFNGWGVMMLGGGLGTPIDWEVPGLMTLDGKPTRDADAVASALLDAGFGVMRWHAIRRGDPEHAKDPMMMDPPPFALTVEQARKAFAAFRDTKRVLEPNIFLLGHSLGARRAAVLLEDNPKFAGLVMLAGASLTPYDREQATALVLAARRSFHELDRNHDQTIGLDELEKALKTDEFAADPIDAVAEVWMGRTAHLHGDELMDAHDWAMLKLLRNMDRWYKSGVNEDERHGMPWAVASIRKANVPVLAIVGDLDERRLVEAYAVTLEMSRSRGYTFKVYKGLGHNLGWEKAESALDAKGQVIADSKTGPMSADVIRDVVAWLQQRVAARNASTPTQPKPGG